MSVTRYSPGMRRVHVLRDHIRGILTVQSYAVFAVASANSLSRILHARLCYADVCRLCQHHAS